MHILYKSTFKLIIAILAIIATSGSYVYNNALAYCGSQTCLSNKCRYVYEGATFRFSYFCCQWAEDLVTYYQPCFNTWTISYPGYYPNLRFCDINIVEFGGTVYSCSDEGHVPIDGVVTIYDCNDCTPVNYYSATRVACFYGTTVGTCSEIWG